jgi:Fe-S cluster biogenesis protein NfuA
VTNDAEDLPAEELVKKITAMYGDALERILSIVHAETGERSEAIFARLCDDKLIENILCLHGLHPIALEDRIEAALDSVRTYVSSHKGKITVSRIEGDTVYLRLEGTCDGCPASEATLRQSVERAILERAPEIREVRAEPSDTPIHAGPAALLAHGPVLIGA